MDERNAQREPPVTAGQDLCTGLASPRAGRGEFTRRHQLELEDPSVAIRRAA